MESIRGLTPREKTQNNPMKYVIALLLLLLVCACQAGPGSGTSSDAPKAAPLVTALDQDGKTVDFEELYKAGPVLVYFYPKADTPGCTAQACSLRDSYEKLTEHGITVVGVSSDSTKDQKAFQAKHKLPFTLIADTDKVVMNAFGVSHVAGFAKREAFLIKDSKIVWHDGSASTAKQAEDVLSVVADWK